MQRNSILEGAVAARRTACRTALRRGTWNSRAGPSPKRPGAPRSSRLPTVSPLTTGLTVELQGMRGAT